jgi:outer membrane protein
MDIRLFRIPGLVAAWLISGACSALTLSEAVTLARQGDPAFLGAQANLAVAQERANQAFAGMLPQINASGNTNWNHRVYTTRTEPSTTYDEKFNSHVAQLNLTQPLWRSANRVAVTQADAAVAQANFQLAMADQDLLVRLAQAWFDVLLARDHLIFTQGQVSAAKFEWEQAVRFAGLGVVGTPLREEARMKFDQATAERVAAESDLAVKFAALEKIIGAAAFPALPALSDQFTPQDLSGERLDKWLGLAETDSPAVRAAIAALEVANEEIRKQRAGHEPTVDITSSYAKNAQGSGTYGGQVGYNSTTSAIGLQFNLPIFSGGGQSAKVREAEALRTKAQQELESARRNARTQTKQAWHGWQASQSRLAAAKQSVEYSTLNLQAALSGVATGVKKELDVLRGRQQLYGALRDLARARYELTLNYFKLKAAVGQLVDEDLIALDKWLVVSKQ